MNFPKTYVIQMPGSKRNPELYTSLNFLKIDYQIQEAVVGKNLTDQEILEYVNLKSCDARLGYRISNNLIGSGLSHRKIYQKMMSEGIEWALILEEDAILSDFNRDEISKIISEISNEPTIIQLFSRAARLMKNKSIQQIYGSKRITFNFLPRIAGCGAPAYLINQSAAQRALTNHFLDGAPDWPPWALGVQMMGVFPWMVNESNEGSTMPVEPISQRKYLLRRFSQFTGIHYLKFFREYSGPISYIKEEILPYLLHLTWRANGSKHYLGDERGPQIIK